LQGSEKTFCEDQKERDPKEQDLQRPVLEERRIKKGPQPKAVRKKEKRPPGGEKVGNKEGGARPTRENAQGDPQMARTT